ncbi:hypothetical protein [Streptomyces sp. NPDC002545]
MSAGSDGSVEDYAGAGGNQSGAGDATAPAVPAACAAADKPAASFAAASDPAAFAAGGKPAACAAAGKGSSST